MTIIIEKLIRPFQLPLGPTPIPRSEPAAEDDPAVNTAGEVDWVFSWQTAAVDINFRTHTIIWPEDKPVEQAVEVPTLEFEEYERNVTNVRVENPADSDQFVVVERINDITFLGPDLRTQEEIDSQDVGLKGKRFSKIFWRFTLVYDD